MRQKPHYGFTDIEEVVEFYSRLAIAISKMPRYGFEGTDVSEELRVELNTRINEYESNVPDNLRNRLNDHLREMVKRKGWGDLELK